MISVSLQAQVSSRAPVDSPGLPILGRIPSSEACAYIFQISLKSVSSKGSRSKNWVGEIRRLSSTSVEAPIGERIDSVRPMTEGSFKFCPIFNVRLLELGAGVTAGGIFSSRNRDVETEESFMSLGLSVPMFRMSSISQRGSRLI